MKIRIRRTISQFCGHPLLEAMLFLGLTFLILSFGIYFWQRIVGDLPSQEEWYQRRIGNSNLSLWHDDSARFLVLYPYLVLIPLTLVFGILLSLGKRSIILLVHSLAICFVLSMIAIFQLMHFSWIID